MENFLAEKDYDCGSSKIDLTLKLSPCGEDPEERKVKKLSSMLRNGTHLCPFVPSLGRSSSLPSEAGKGMVLQKQGMVTNLVEGASYTIPFMAYTIPFMARQLSVERVRNNSMGNSSKALMENGITPPRPPSYTKNKAAMVMAATTTEILPDRYKLGNYCTLEGDVMENLKKMPVVTTTGDGPNGKRIEGILYKYMDGEVCIVCVCHGNFFTPAEFIAHAGGKEVENPIKHITVYTTSF